MKTHILNLITTKNIRDALDTIMIAKPERVLNILRKHYNSQEMAYIADAMEELLDYLDIEVK
jgi:hypothetical protein